MISVRRPDDAAIERYRSARLDVAPTCAPSDEPLAGYHRDHVATVIGHGTHALAAAGDGLRAWAAHRGGGVEVHPGDAALEEGAVVAIVTRQLGLWVLAACRVVEVVDGPTTVGFTYATLPDHPEQGYESFTARLADDGTATFHLDVVSRPAVAVVRLGAPVARRLQRRATGRYLAAMRRWVADQGAA